MTTYQTAPCWEKRPHRAHLGSGYWCNGVWPDDVPTVEQLGDDSDGRPIQVEGKP